MKLDLIKTDIISFVKFDLMKTDIILFSKCKSEYRDLKKYY